jgi:hypothetical protein
LFPPELRDKEFLNAEKRFEKTQEFLMIANNSEKRLTLPSPLDIAEQNEQDENLHVALKMLTKKR